MSTFKKVPLGTVLISPLFCTNIALNEYTKVVWSAEKETQLNHPEVPNIPMTEAKSIVINRVQTKFDKSLFLAIQVTTRTNNSAAKMYSMN